MAITDLQQLQTTKSNLLAALAADSVSPQPTYSLDGESVSQSEWRDAIFAQVAQCNKLIEQENPFEIRTYAI